MDILCFDFYELELSLPNSLLLASLFQIPNHVAIKIALELKKLLIDNSLLDVYAVSYPLLSHFSAVVFLYFCSFLFFSPPEF